MEYIKNPDFHLENTAVALGKFEGLHLGHQLLFDEIKKQRNKGQKSVVFTFDMPPRSALSGDYSYRQIYTSRERRVLLEKMGMDVLIEHPFTKEFAAQSPEEFVQNILVKKAGAKTIVVGEDCRFGKKRSGDVRLLRRLSESCGYKLIVIKKLQMGQEDVSSTKIRSCLEQGDMEGARQLLGRPYTIVGEVVHGKALGRTIQIPTANQVADINKMMPPNGVYVSRIYIEGMPEPFYGITNVGVKPTVEQEAVKGVETNIFHFHEDIYGKMLQVELLHYHRPEIHFHGVDELRNQMGQDILFASRYLTDNGLVL